MPGPPRTSKACVVKTFRFDPSLVEDMERVTVLTGKEGTPKYPSVTNLIVVAVTALIKQERRELEKEGVVWEHLRPGFKQSIKQKEK